MKTEKLIICGASGSGKDYLQRELKKKELLFEPKITTRPKRIFETEGVEYFFISNDEFQSMIEQDLILTYQTFVINNSEWHYAITKKNFETNQLFIMTPFEISKLNEEQRKKSFVVYLDIDEEIRRSRVLRRNDMNDSISRRFISDKEDFRNFTDYDMKVNDPDFEVDLVYDLMT